MRQNPPLSDELISKISAGLDELPIEPRPKRPLALLLTSTSEQIRNAQARGASYVEIARQIAASGYPIKASTLRASVIRHRAEPSRAPSPRRRPAQKNKSSYRNQREVVRSHTLEPVRSSGGLLIACARWHANQETQFTLPCGLTRASVIMRGCSCRRDT